MRYSRLGPARLLALAERLEEEALTLLQTLTPEALRHGAEPAPPALVFLVARLLHDATIVLSRSPLLAGVPRLSPRPVYAELLIGLRLTRSALATLREDWGQDAPEA
jgi:hypothetical protein